MMGMLGRLWLAAGLLGGAITVGAAACSDDTSVATGHGNAVTYVDATMQPQGPGDSSADYAFFDPVDAGYSAPPDGYDPVGLCNQCACPGNTYCFGGGTGYTSFSGVCDAGGNALALGCRPLPASCPDASCVCLLEAVSASVSCVPQCIDNTRTVYCNNP